ncbi:hypothetical protein B0J13DRAFT_583275 [Dactylonectria estremocensis]|uniref:Uncharacterized protein n=1 Tax=Dactylonectria estremocensis TaxID=1079267 RepID=A0A9P9J4M7_9HYPO|nr:hypothetical protein B0J13DRAFT_583275 [Dactylonectria estremocensis]
MMSAGKMMAMRTARVSSVIAGRSISMSTSARLGLKESSSQTNVDYDHHKKDSLAKQKKGDAHWKPELASDSEEAVKADRAAMDSTPEEVQKLQERTKRAAEETSKAGTSMRDNM